MKDVDTGTASDHLDPAGASEPEIQLPEAPKIEGLWEQLPGESTPKTQGTSPERLMLCAANEMNQFWVPDQPGVKKPGHFLYLIEFTQGGQAAVYTLTWRQRWRQVPNTYTHVYPGGGYTKAYKTTHGISRTDAESISAELGVEVGGLGAKLQATFEYSITVSEEESEETGYSVGSPAEGYVRVWVLWQLVDEVVALDPQGNVLDFGTEHGRIDIPPVVGNSECSLSYPNVQQKFAAKTFVPMQRDFPESSAPAGVSIGALGPTGLEGI
jgi:hypothetical protein